MSLTAEQIRQFTADGETKACAPILAVGASVRLLKRLEDDLLLIDAECRCRNRTLRRRRPPWA